MTQHVCGDEKMTRSNKFSPCRSHMDSKDQTQVRRLDGKYLYPLNHLVTRNFL